MRKRHYVYICILLVFLTGCGDNPEYAATESDRGISVEYGGQKSSNYDEYIGKMWVRSEEPNEKSSSFTITALNEGKIEGGGNLFGDFAGTVEGNRAEFDFEWREDTGKVVMELLPHDEIAVKVTYSKRDLENRGSMETEEIFRLFKLSDIEPFIPNDALSFGMELDTMGYRYFAAGIYDNEVRPSAALYMTDRDGNIFNDFMVSWINLMEIVKLSVEDINEDGRSDIRVWIAMKEKTMLPFFQGIFLQNSDGSFPDKASVVDLILYQNDSINFQKEKSAPKGLPDALEDEIRRTLTENTFSKFIGKYETTCRQLSDSEKQQYSMADETGLLARCLEAIETKDDAWFVSDGTGSLIIRHEQKGEKYAYYNYQRGHGKDAYLMRAVGLNKAFYIIQWNGSEYLVTTKMRDGMVTGIAVYCMHGEESYGWLLYQEKTGEGQIVTRYYSYIEDAEGTGTYWPEYEFLYD